MAFTARTSKAYRVLPSSIDTVWLVVLASLPEMSVQVVASGTLVPAAWRTWYFVIALPPFFGVDQFSVTWRLPGVAVRLPGAWGSFRTMILTLTMSPSDQPRSLEASHHAMVLGDWWSASSKANVWLSRYNTGFV